MPPLPALIKVTKQGTLASEYEIKKYFLIVKIKVMSNKKNNSLKFILIGGLALLISVVIYYGFFIEPASAGCTCNAIENDCLYCYVHPFTVADGIGLALLFASFYVAVGLTKFFPGEKLLPVGSVSGNIIGVVAGVLGLLLIWLL